MSRMFNSCVNGVGYGSVPAYQLPRSSSTPVSMGQQNAVDGVGILPIVILGLGALGITGGFGYWAGHSSSSTPQTFSGEIGKQVGSGLKWAAIGLIGYVLVTGNNPIKSFLKKK